MAVLCESSYLLVAMLEAIVYDPLIISWDWSAEGKQGRREEFADYGVSSAFLN